VLQSWFARSGIGGRDANLLSDAARRNLQHPFAYALARNVALANCPPGAACAVSVVQQRQHERRFRDFPLAIVQLQRCRHSASEFRHACIASVSVGTRMRRIARMQLHCLTTQRVDVANIVLGCTTDAFASHLLQPSRTTSPVAMWRRAERFDVARNCDSIEIERATSQRRHKPLL
jgi:hypothetical protein